MPNMEQAIRERAYHLWLADGCQHGKCDSYWLDAQRDVLTESVAAAVSAVAPKSKARARAKPKVAPTKAPRKAAAKSAKRRAA